MRLDLLKLHGRRYVFDHCLSQYRAGARERLYRAYVTDALKVLTENTARAVGGNYLKDHWLDSFTPPDDRSFSELAEAVIIGAGLKHGGQATESEVE